MSQTPEVKDAVSIVRNRRTDAMFVAAYIMVGGLAWTVIYEDAVSQYAQGVITLVLGNFIGYLTAMYNFETGTTRSTQAKDAVLSAAVTATASAAVAVQPWVTGKLYTNEQVVSPNGAGVAYTCIVPHTSGVFKDDLAAGKWALKNP